MILVSACLLGMRTRYDGGKLVIPKRIRELIGKGECIIPVCPEQLGGLPTPRVKSFVEWSGDTPTVKGEGGEEGEEGELRSGGAPGVEDKGDKDVTVEFLKGAAEALRIAETLGIRKAILKSRSPSCGGEGVTTRFLRAQGIEVEVVDAEKDS